MLRGKPDGWWELGCMLWGKPGGRWELVVCYGKSQTGGESWVVCYEESQVGVGRMLREKPDGWWELVVCYEESQTGGESWSYATRKARQVVRVGLYAMRKARREVRVGHMLWGEPGGRWGLVICYEESQMGDVSWSDGENDNGSSSDNHTLTEEVIATYPKNGSLVSQ